MRIRHLITKYEEGGRAWAEAWVQVDLLGRCWCLWRRRIPLDWVPTLGSVCPCDPKWKKEVDSALLADKGLTYFSRKTFDVAMERLGIPHAECEWDTVAEMTRALDGTDLGVVMAIVPFDDVCDIGDCLKALQVVDLRPPAGEIRAEDGAEHRAGDAEDAGQDDRHVPLDEVAPPLLEVAAPCAGQ